MASMYEMIMDLPLFKGVSKDHVSLFLEKTNIDFKNYDAGDVLAELDDDVRMVRFVIAGQTNLIHPLEGTSISVVERIGFGKVLGADRLFGLATGYPYTAIAETRTSVMEFSKEQYVNLLLSDRIYMLNFFNYLSLRAQRPVDSAMHFCKGDIHSRLALLISMVTEPAALHIMIRGGIEALASYCGCTSGKMEEWIAEMKREGVVDFHNDIIEIKSRRAFLDL